VSAAGGVQPELHVALERIVGAGGLVTAHAERRALSADVYSAGATCALAIRPTDRGALADAVRLLAEAGYALIPRGGGLTYTGGYTPPHEHSVIVDTSRLDRIVAINAEDMTITVEAGVTWKRIHEALAPLGLRLPFFGTFSGARATVGGGLSNGALFHGTARYGTGADGVLGLEVVLADGSFVATGQAGFGGKPFYRTFGPDLTGLFLHDCGALGIKVAATLRLIRAPAETGFASFAVPDIERAALLLAEITRSGAAEEAYAFDPRSPRARLAGVALGRALRTLQAVVGGQSSWLKGLKEGARLVTAGRDFAPDEAWSVHVACAGRSEAAVAADLAACRGIAEQFGVDWHSIGDAEGKADDERLVALLDEYQIDYLVLARYMRILPAATCWKYAGGRIINLHHGLLPSFPGLQPYHDAYAGRMLTYGATCHFIVPELDAGNQIIHQATFTVAPGTKLDEIVRIGQSDNEPRCLVEGVRRVVSREVQLHFHRVVKRT